MEEADEELKFDLDLAVVIANVLRSKAELEANKEGKSLSEREKAGVKAFNASLRKKAQEFLKKVEDRIAEINNQEVAKLLTALIAMGLSIEDEDELEYWIAFLEREVFLRIISYFAIVEEQGGGISRFAKHKKRFLSNTKEFSVEDLEALSTMMLSVNRTLARKRPKDKDSPEYKKFLEREKFFKKVENMLKEERSKKVKEQAKQRKQQNVKGNKKNRKTSQESYGEMLGRLKTKMTLAGVVVGGEYWDQTIAGFDSSLEKAEFVNSWSHDGRSETLVKEKSYNQKVGELRGVKEREEVPTRQRDDNVQRRESNVNERAVPSRVNQGRGGKSR